MSQAKKDSKIIREFISLMTDKKRYGAAKAFIELEHKKEIEANESLKKSITININM